MAETRQIGRRTWLTRMATGAVALWAGLDFGRGKEGWGVLLSQPRRAEAAQAGTPAQIVPVSIDYASPTIGTLPVAAFIWIRGREAAVVDSLVPGNGLTIGTALQTAGLDWRAVRHLILTHFHFDHAGSAAEVADLAPQATIWAGEPDIPQITVPRDISPAYDGDEVFGLRIVTTPGHTPGHITVYDPANSAVALGDTLVNMEGYAFGPIPQFTNNMEDAMASLRKLAALGFERGLFAHGPIMERGAAAAIGQIAARGPQEPTAAALAAWSCCMTHPAHHGHHA
jgi:glyoxylase-like metal-dependent hydrolase (beta-lactamase superfamily II)